MVEALLLISALPRIVSLFEKESGLRQPSYETLLTLFDDDHVRAEHPYAHRQFAYAADHNRVVAIIDDRIDLHADILASLDRVAREPDQFRPDYQCYLLPVGNTIGRGVIANA